MAKKAPKTQKKKAAAGSVDRRIEAKLDYIITLLQTSSRKETRAMTKIDDLKNDFQARLDRLSAEVAAQTTVTQSAATLLDGQTANIAALKAQVEELLKSGGGDLSQFQPVLDAFDTQIAAAEAAKESLVAAVTANTPSA